MLPEPVASILRSGRAQYNARFAAARHRWPELDGESFKLFFGDFVAPIVAIADSVRPGCGVAVTEAAYDVALELVGQRLAGRQPRHGAIHALWAQVLGPLAVHLAAAPARVLPALHNAAHQLATTPEARTADWLRALATLGPRAGDADELLRLGQVLAWRAGLAHFRAGALAAAEALRPELAVAAVGAPAAMHWHEVRAQFAADPWWVPPARDAAAADVPVAHPRLARVAGAFRGFGGPFLAPPRVIAHRDHLLVRSGDDVWVLCADAFGATFHRATPEEAAIQPDAWASPPPALRAARQLPELASWGDITSAVQLGPTLALTGALTHQVALVAV